MLIRRLLFVLIPLLAASAQPYLGVGQAWSEDPAGVELTRIVPRSPAMIAGLKTGDVISVIDSDTLFAAADLGLILSTREPGQRITLTIWRSGEQLLLPLILGNREDYTGLMRRQPRDRFPDSTTLLFPEPEPLPVTLLIEQTIYDFELRPAYERLRHAFRQELHEYRGFHTLDATAAVLLEPGRIGSIGEQLLETSGGRSGETTIDQLDGMFFCLQAESVTEAISYDGTLAGLIELLQLSNRLLGDAFTDLTPAEVVNLANWFDPLLESFITTFYIHWEEELELVAAFEDLIASTQRINYDALAEAAQLLGSIDNREALQRLEQELHFSYGVRQPVDGYLLDTLIALDAEWEGSQVEARLLLADSGSQLHRTTAALLLDLGGDDIYLNNAGGTPYSIANGTQHHFRQGRTGFCIDFGGDDSYLCNGIGSIGSGLAGNGLLIDLSGDDIYSGARLSQGSSFAGTGLLHDYGGDDIYLGQEGVQGAAFFGAGLLRDDEGDDRYSAALYAQGCGGARGCGQLLDCLGDDHYLASHKHPNGYGNEATWSGWSQGVGVGFRQLAAGGLGILSDRQGNDRYLAGNFSQGCGYFFGFGLFFDREGNDRVTGNRYCQAALAHQAASWFLDEEGNDIYFGQEATNQGGTWDVGAALFLDAAGNDSYQGGSLSQGGCAQNAVALFCDLGGDDSYNAGSSSQGAGGGNSYHDGRGALSLGLFFDLGTGQDSYADSTRGNNRQFLTDSDDDPTSGEGVFIDR